MTFKYVKEQLKYVSGSGVMMFSRIGLAHAAHVDIETVEKWEESDEIPKKYRSRVDHYIKEKLKERSFYE